MKTTEVKWDKHHSTFEVPDVSPLAMAFTDWSLVHSLNIGDEVYYSANDGTGKYRYGARSAITSINPDAGYIVVKVVTYIDNYYVLLQKGRDVIASSPEELIEKMTTTHKGFSESILQAVENVKKVVDKG